MHSKIVAIVLAAMMFVSAAVVFSSSDDSDAADPETITIEGYVASENGTALASKTVVIGTSEAPSLGQGTTDSNGKFSITMDKPADVSTLRIRIVYEGTAGTVDEVNYKIISAPEGIELMGIPGDDHTVLSLNLTKFPLSGSTYTLADSLLHAIQVANATSTVAIHVVGKDNKELYGAKVSLYDGQRIVASGVTDYYGICELSSTISYDTYRLVIKCNGYKDYESNLVVNESQIYPEITLIEKQAPTFLGMTTYHVLMLFGVILGLALVVISYILVARNWKGMQED